MDNETLSKEIKFYNEYSKCQKRYSRLKVKKDELMAVIEVIENFDEIFSNVNNSNSEFDLEKYLIEKYGFKKSQLKACMDISISCAVQSDEKEKILKKLEDVEFKLTECEQYLNDTEKKKDFERICRLYDF